MNDKDLDRLLDKFSLLPRKSQVQVFEEMDRLIDRLLKAKKLFKDNKGLYPKPPNP
jgi:hypothetical protein